MVVDDYMARAGLAGFREFHRTVAASPAYAVRIASR
jgi:hypothetical protein